MLPDKEMVRVTIAPFFPRYLHNLAPYVGALQTYLLMVDHGIYGAGVGLE